MNKTKPENVELPSNRKFGLFFSAVFFGLCIYFLCFKNYVAATTFGSVSLVLLFVTSVSADHLLPLNRLWMNFGVRLGSIMNPIIMALVFFGVITPYAVLMRVVRRDALRLKKTNLDSYWIYRSPKSSQTDFKRQF